MDLNIEKYIERNEMGGSAFLLADAVDAGFALPSTTSPEDWAALWQALAKDKVLAIQLDTVEMPASAWQTLADALLEADDGKAMSHLQAFTASGCCASKVPIATWAAVCKGLAALESLETVRFETNALSDEYCAALGDAFAAAEAASPLYELSLSYNDLGPTAGVEALAKLATARSDTLAMLLIRTNEKLGADLEAFEQLCTAVAGMTAIATINLNQCGLGADAFDLLCAALAKCKPIRHVNSWGNPAWSEEMDARVLANCSPEPDDGDFGGFSFGL
jgi:Ran GTPase-activating protein (RanGAP) involved in mRNA processing and transport